MSIVNVWVRLAADAEVRHRGAGGSRSTVLTRPGWPRHAGPAPKLLPTHKGVERVTAPTASLPEVRNVQKRTSAWDACG